MSAADSKQTATTMVCHHVWCLARELSTFQTPWDTNCFQCEGKKVSCLRQKLQLNGCLPMFPFQPHCASTPTDRSSSGMTPSLWPVQQQETLVAGYSRETLHLRFLCRAAPAGECHVSPAAPLRMPIHRTLESTGASLSGGSAAAPSTSPWLVRPNSQEQQGQLKTPKSGVFLYKMCYLPSCVPLTDLDVNNQKIKTETHLKEDMNRVCFFFRWCCDHAEPCTSCDSRW